MAKETNTANPVHEFKDLPAVALKAGEVAGTVEAIVAVFNNTDQGNERILPGAFADSLKAKLPRMVWSHDWTKIIGKALEAEELLPGDSRLPLSIRSLGGLRVLAKMFTNTDDGRNAYEVIKELGDQIEFSIGYTVAPGGDRVAKDGVRELMKLNLMEFSPVLSGMNPATVLLAVKTIGAEAAALSRAGKDYLASLEPVAADDDEAEDVQLAESVAAAFENFRTQVAAVAGDQLDAINILIDGLETAVTSAIALEEYQEDLTEATEAPASQSVTITLAGNTQADAELKAGRVLSSKNYDRLKMAHEHLTAVLEAATADVPKDESGKSDAPLNSQAVINDGNTKTDQGETTKTEAVVASDTAESATLGTAVVNEQKALELDARIQGLSTELKEQMARTKALKIRLGIHD